MRRGVVLACLLSLTSLGPLGAQSVRGVVVDDSTKLPVATVLITLIDAGGQEILPGVRSDSLGGFMVHAGRPGTYRVKASRIGYRPLTSDRVQLGMGELAVLRLRMTTVAQQLIPIRVVERRALSASELMSTTGFDLRESKGLGRFLSGEQLADLGLEGVREVLASQLRPTLYVEADSISGADVLRIRQGLRGCAPEIYLDGELLAAPPEQAGIFDSAGLVTAMDSVRLGQRQAAEFARVGAGQEYAMSVLSNLRANMLHGIEVYRANEVPPPSLGAWFGITKRSVTPCGTVAVWTKLGNRRLVAPRNPRAPGLQVITGIVVDAHTGAPVGNVPITLLTESRQAIGEPVRSDAGGEFTIRTTRVGSFRLLAGNIGFSESTTPVLPVTTDEMVVVKFFVSPTLPVIIPLAVATRVFPQTFGITSLGGFTYRRERALGGTFFRTDEIEKSGARTVSDLVRTLAHVQVVGAAPTDTVTFMRGDDLPRCRPLYFIDGTPVATNVEATIGAITMDRVFGVEVYTKQSEIPAVFADAGTDCGLVAIWLKR